MIMGFLAVAASSICSHQNPPLHLAWRVVVVVVEPDFAPGNDPGMPGKNQHFFVGVAVRQTRLMRMHADRRPYPIVPLGIGNGARDLGRAVAIANGEHRAQTGRARPSQHFLPVAVEPAAALDMGVRIYVHNDRCSPTCRPPLLQLGAHRHVFQKSGQHRRAFFADEAATIMPFDSSPRSLRGADWRR